jgi:tetratricopeptide (TPR) repeat protein
MSTETLKEQARTHEQNGDWERAQEVYSRALNRMESGDDPDAAVLDRAAEVQIQLGKPEAALELYERAIELYRESDLPNNAVAICRKVRRQIPSQVRILLKMGEIQAQQGFRADARETFRSYAKIMQVRGEKDRAFAGLEEMVLRLPDDPRARLLLATDLLGMGRSEEAMIHLMGAWRTVLERGIEGELRDTLRDRILAMDPKAELDERKILPTGARGFVETTSAESGLEGIAGLDFSGLEVVLELDGKEGAESLTREPDPLPPVDALRQAVVRAQEAGDRAGLIGSLVNLAKAVRPVDEGEAETLFVQVLQLDAANPIALAALGRSGPFDGPLSLAEVEPPTEEGPDAIAPSPVEPASDWSIEFELGDVLSQPEPDPLHLYREGRLEEAREGFQKRVDRSPADDESREALAQCWLDLGDPRQALQVLSDSPGTNAQALRAPALYLRGGAQEDLGDLAQARALYTQVSQIDPGFRDVALRLERLS